MPGSWVEDAGLWMQVTMVLSHGIHLAATEWPTSLTTHWRFCIPERTDYKLAVMAYCSLQGLSPRYLNPLRLVSDTPSLHNLHSSTSGWLEVSAHPLNCHCRSTVIWLVFIHSLEHSTDRHLTLTESACFLLSAENMLIPAFIPRFIALGFVYSLLSHDSVHGSLHKCFII
jgi:hypothetical protein